MINGIVTKDFVFGGKTLHKGDVVLVFKEGIVYDEFIAGASDCEYACKHEYIKQIAEHYCTAVLADIKARNNLLKYLWHSEDGEVSKQFEPEVQKLLEMYDSKVKEAVDILISKSKKIEFIPKATPVEKEVIGIPDSEV